MPLGAGLASSSSSLGLHMGVHSLVTVCLSCNKGCMPLPQRGALRAGSPLACLVVVIIGPTHGSVTACLKRNNCCNPLQQRGAVVGQPHNVQWPIMLMVALLYRKALMRPPCNMFIVTF